MVRRVPTESAALLVVLSLFVAGAAHAAPGPDPAGFGAYPLTAVHAAAWFHETYGSSAEKKQLILMAYTVGPPGWVAKGAKFTADLKARPASISFECNGVPVGISYDLRANGVRIAGRDFKLDQANTFLVTTDGKTKPRVQAIGRFDLSFGAEDNPATVLAGRETQVRAALLGRAPTIYADAAPAGSHRDSLVVEAKRLARKRDDTSVAQACSLFARAAELGSRDAQYGYGVCLQRNGPRQDLAAANDWLQRAAVQGHASAMFKLGWSARLGRGTAENAAEAHGWFRQCAAEGDSICAALVGRDFETGDGVQASVDSAVAWYRMSAEDACLEGQLAVARIGASVSGEKVDAVEALMWLDVLDAQSQTLPDETLADLEAWRPRLEKRVKSDAQRTARQRADAWLLADSNRQIDALGAP